MPIVRESTYRKQLLKKIEMKKKKEKKKKGRKIENYIQFAKPYVCVK